MSISPFSGPAAALNYVRTGPRSGAPVVLLHAVGLDLTCWAHQFEALGADFDLVGVDLRGHGASSDPRDGYTLHTLASDVAALIQALGSGPAHVVGLSVGGMIAQTLALAHPQSVRSLSLIATTATLPEAAREPIRERARLVRSAGMQAIVEPTLERWFTPAFLARRPDVADRIRKQLMGNDKDIHAAMWEAIGGIDVAPQLQRVDCPTLVIVGDQDKATPAAGSELIASRIPQARLHILPGVPHMAPIEAPGLVNPLLMEFLTSMKGLK